MREINVAISLHISKKPGSNIFSNGAVQHTIFLYQLFKKISYVKNVWLGVQNDTNIDKKWLLEEIKNDIVPMKSIIHDVDLLIEMSAAVTVIDVETVKNGSGRFVSCKFGSEYVMAVESLNFGAHPGWVPNRANLIADAVWMNRQHMHTSKKLQEKLYRSEVVEMPHLWDPYFLKKMIKSNSISKRGWPYRSTSKPKSISIFEPNINIVKSTLIPFYIAAGLYEKHEAAILKIFMYNTVQIVDNPLFKRVVMSTIAGKNGVATAEKRYNFADAMGQKGGVVLTHQWECALNYLYYEALYGGFPLVHNSPFLKSVGYYYEDFDIDDGVHALERAVFEHDNSIKNYQKKANAFLSTINPNNQIVIDEYDKEIRRLFS